MLFVRRPWFAAGLVHTLVSATCLYPPPIVSQADADQFTLCPTVTGSITIATNAVGSLSIDGPKVITGSLVTADCSVDSNCNSLTSISSSSLKTIEEDLTLGGAQNLSKISFALLETVRTLTLADLPGLETIDFDRGLTEVGSGTVTLQRLPSLQNVSGLDFEDIGVLSIDVGSLTEITMVLKTSSQMVNVRGDGRLHLNMPDLRSTSFLTVSGCAGVNFPSLTTSANASLLDNTFNALSLPKLDTTTNSYLTISNNSKLYSLELPLVTEADILTISGNPQLLNVNGISNLENVNVLKIDGAFATLSIPKAKAVGDLVLHTSDTTFNCSIFNEYRNASIITGYYECQGTTLALKSRAGKLLSIDMSLTALVICLGFSLSII